MKRHQSSGFAYVEVLVAAVVLAVALVPASEAFRAAFRQADHSRVMLIQHYRALASLEVTQTKTFGQLLNAANSTGGTTPSTYSDASGTAYRRVVYVSRIDFDNADNDNNTATGIDNGVVRIQVIVEGTPISLYAIAGNRV
jgi:Tfp pilus assembly protein PilV